MLLTHQVLDEQREQIARHSEQNLEAVARDSQSGVRDLHLGVHRSAQGCDERARGGTVNSPALDAERTHWMTPMRCYRRPRTRSMCRCGSFLAAAERCAPGGSREGHRDAEYLRELIGRSASTSPRCNFVPSMLESFLEGAAGARGCASECDTWCAVARTLGGERLLRQCLATANGRLTTCTARPEAAIDVSYWGSAMARRVGCAIGRAGGEHAAVRAG